MNRTLKQIVRTLLVVGALAALGVACDGQRFCPEQISCARLAEFTCGEDDRCGDTKSCLAAMRLVDKADEDVCHTAWCDLGVSYRECGVLGGDQTFFRGRRAALASRPDTSRIRSPSRPLSCRR